ncbi:hypothetical protein ACWC09_42730 [Streptomyces sp. NPDC001617]
MPAPFAPDGGLPAQPGDVDGKMAQGTAAPFVAELGAQGLKPA